MACTTVYTVGYGGRQPQDFLDVLEQHGVETVVDVRLRPDRTRLRSFVRANEISKGIERLLAERRIAYVSLIELGNPFMDDDDWRPRYERLITSAGEVLTERLFHLPGPLCLMCAERRAATCHRWFIAAYLAQYHDFTIQHLP
jgi:uncharacterized protein (DUF488 family)